MVQSEVMMTFEARPGKEIEIEEVLENGLKSPGNHQHSPEWYVMRVGASSYAIIHKQADHEILQSRLLDKAGHLFVDRPKIDRICFLPGAG